MPSVFTWPVRVYYEDTDAGGIVFYANYLKFFERARTEWLRAFGIEQQLLLDGDQTAFVVRNVTLDYRAPARLDDLLEIRTRVAHLGRASIDFSQEAWCGDVLLNSAEVKVACVNKATMRPRALPDALIAKLSAA